MNIQGQAALVTGGGSGLGEATARELARLGAKVAVLDINLANAQQVAADIGGVAIQCDITDGASLQAAIEQAAAAHGPARILAHIAGIGAAKRVIGKDGNAAPLEDFARIINVNLIGTYNAARLFAAACAKLDPLEDGERGVMVFTASRGGLRRPGRPAGLQRLQGRCGRHDAADGARPRSARHPRLHHRARAVLHPAHAHAARTGAGLAGGQHPVPAAAG
jgi:NAD(P)-dependent dehydrogenase (short-subunit alcohol dehydrogenase family)